MTLMQHARTYLLLSIFGMVTSGVIAQDNQYLTSEDSDPQAVDLLDRMHKLIERDVLQVDFSLTITYPAEDPIEQTGYVVQQGPKYYVHTDNAEIWCDGKSRWVYVKDTKEVNLYSATRDEQGGPLDLISEYLTDKYVAGISGEAYINEKPVSLVEIKPVSRDSDIAKARFSIASDGAPKRVEVFEKSGTRTTMNITGISTPKKAPDAYFTFDASKYPGVHLEDLRID